MEIAGKKIRINWPLSQEETERVEAYFRENRIPMKFVTAEDFAESTGLNEYAASDVLKTLSDKMAIRKIYAIFCPHCGRIVDRGVYSSEIRQSGYECPWCGKTVGYEMRNLRNLYIW